MARGLDALCEQVGGGFQIGELLPAGCALHEVGVQLRSLGRVDFVEDGQGQQVVSLLAVHGFISKKSGVRSPGSGVWWDVNDE